MNLAKSVLAVSLAGTLALGVGSAAAQDAATESRRPVQILAGTCESPGEVVAELRDLTTRFDDRDDDGDDQDDDADDQDDDADDRDDDDAADDQAGGTEFAGAEDAAVVEGSEDSDVRVDLATLLATPHVIAVFDGDGSTTMIACGAVGGFVSGEGDDLAVGLREQNDSGFAGVALLNDDDDDRELDVDVYLMPVVARG